MYGSLFPDERYLDFCINLKLIGFFWNFFCFNNSYQLEFDSKNKSLAIRNASKTKKSLAIQEFKLKRGLFITDSKFMFIAKQCCEYIFDRLLECFILCPMFVIFIIIVTILCTILACIVLLFAPGLLAHMIDQHHLPSAFLII